jgi:hypothetical protein
MQNCLTAFVDFHIRFCEDGFISMITELSNRDKQIVLVMGTCVWWLPLMGACKA